ncbi:MAG: hypothetical protein A2487_06300 [Candidatus Raymondbacteria bacterium RifOxyC12_full_50_8]|uniref:SPOR domain-containing protein n=1 Tax=Candidatus Raymondbacteria bacterium RIFOXYD12_FULL_49_13 TaxID=1817890 RepID=A0A1F7FC40_UNCRA|nr:MAG: hypothetical protein A2248_03200 [Candidatus Raymondbacteria bacterium RIFOXYA2_FULL_49_16]OGJ93294.1 MAG: hypothetical protein A2350_14595 [Candidatus Raymondbacteria bacterium RifOxyB12_full_50_8]OGK04255.1 MAG: hypothetical protein A2519_18005 [Candidatus Raymondbacteria bacterium RIFOXYD12_FULL_49_13]OGK06058.1 MAG: hypothetical protein A2487_06300 [Candidatus Raymondbacteria bacterium RifOxyC12_full_50_8]OGP42462.1 MAG: hypothetical protein A2324_17235 [Candidatus Raymondbacteria b
MRSEQGLRFSVWSSSIAFILACCAPLFAESPLSSQGLFKEGQRFYAMGDYARAAASFTRNVQETPSDPGSLLWGGFSYMAASQYDSAIAVFQSIPGASGIVFLKAQVGLGMALSAQRKYTEANIRLIQALSLNETAFRSSGYYQLQKNFWEMGNIEKSDEYAGKLLLEFPHALETRLLAKELSAPAQGLARVPPAITNATFGVQVGAFGDRANAKRLLAELRVRYHHVEIREKTGNDKKTVYAVVVGDFDVREKAAQFAQEKLGERFKAYIIIEK